MNEISMIITEKKIGRPTVRQGGDDQLARIAGDGAVAEVLPSARCVAFSVITIDWSTRMPIEIVMPASDMMFAWMSTIPSHAQQPHQ